jgi:hypothetical protein
VALTVAKLTRSSPRPPPLFAIVTFFSVSVPAPMPTAMPPPSPEPPLPDAVFPAMVLLSIVTVPFWLKIPAPKAAVLLVTTLLRRVRVAPSL